MSRNTTKQLLTCISIPYHFLPVHSQFFMRVERTVRGQDMKDIYDLSHFHTMKKVGKTLEANVSLQLEKNTSFRVFKESANISHMNSFLSQIYY